MNTMQQLVANSEITIEAEEYQQLLDDQQMLYALQATRVDNWEGFDIAMEFFNTTEIEEEIEEDEDNEDC